MFALALTAMLYAGTAQAGAIFTWDLAAVGGGNIGNNVDVAATTIVPGTFDLNVKAYSGSPPVRIGTKISANSVGFGIISPGDVNNQIDNGVVSAAIFEYFVFELPTLPLAFEELTISLAGLGAGERAYVGSSNVRKVDPLSGLTPLVGTRTYVAGTSNSVDTYALDYTQLGNYLIVGADRRLPSGNSRFRVSSITAKVPEPATLLLMAVGLLGLAAVARGSRAGLGSA